MNNAQQEALDFIVRLTGGVQHIPLIDAYIQEVLSDYNNHHMMCSSSSLHWWEETWLVNGEVIVIGGEHNEPATTADLLILLR